MIKVVIILPFITTAAYTLGVGEIVDDKRHHIFLSGLVAALVAGLSLSGELLYLAFNVVPYFAIYLGLTYIYRKNNNNIWFSITTIMLYTLFASLIIARIA
jgi:hypothetical protein